MSYRAFKRLLGETSLERKNRFLFGIGVVVLVTCSFSLYAYLTEHLAYDQAITDCRLLVAPSLVQQHLIKIKWNITAPIEQVGNLDHFLLKEPGKDWQFHFLTEKKSDDSYERELFKEFQRGVGKPDDLLESVARGIDMFDCLMPTRNGRHGLAFTRFGPVNLKNARHADDPRPLDAENARPAARDYSRAYLHHLTKANEMLGAMLLSAVNLAYYQDLMAGMRAAIGAGRLADFIGETKEGWARGDIPAL